MRKLSALVKDKKHIGISGHVRPDGDCVGSCLALYLYLEKIAPTAVIDVNLEKPSDKFAYIKGFDEIKSDFKLREKYDLYFCLDLSTVDRLGGAVDYFMAAEETVVIDHHVTNDGNFGDNIDITPMASSTCERLYQLMAEDRKKDIDCDIAVALYTGIIHDSGVMQYSCTTEVTLKVVSELINYGFNSSDIINKSFYEKTYVQNQLLGRALLESIVFMNGMGIVSVVDRKLLEFYQAESADLDGIVNQLLYTQGVHFSMLLTEIDTLTYKVSMRSDEAVDLSKVAKIVGGGGHARAAGCTLSGTHHDVINILSEYIEKELKENGYL